MRIITGSARGIQLQTLEGEMTRPTAERAKEALFSMIQFDIEGRSVLDLFGGSGQLGLEALSRGAAKATIIDQARPAVEIIISNAKKTKLFDKCRIACSDYATFIKHSCAGEKYGVIFLDPPYDSDYMPKALSLIADNDVLSKGGVIVCETDSAEDSHGKKSKRKLSGDEKAAAEIAEVTDKVFGGDESLRDRFQIVKTNLYGRARITLLTV